VARWTFVRKPVWRGIGIGLACALVAWLLAGTGLFRGLEDWVLDAWFSWRGRRDSGTRVVLIGLDDASLNALRKPSAFLSPELAEVVRHVSREGAAAIGIDLLVPESMGQQPEIEAPGGAGDARPMGEVVREAGNVVLPVGQLGDELLRSLLPWRAKALDPATAIHPQYAALRFPQPCTVDDARKCLTPKEVALLFAVGADTSYVLLLQAPPDKEDKAQGISIHPLPGRAALADKVASLVDPVRLELPGGARPLGAELYRLLLAPIAQHIKGKNLVIVADGPLCQLPFELLVEGADDQHDGRYTGRG
jgi:hypothetical protein